MTNPNSRVPKVFYSSRTGFTIVEMLVVLAVIGLLASLLMPAVQQARESARRTQCRNNLRQLGLAMHEHGTQFSRLPASGHIGLDTSGAVAPFFSWAVEVLPQLDQANRYQKWDFSKPLGDSNNQGLATGAIPVFRCPSDISTKGRGDMSYVVNGGFGWTVALGGIGDCPIGFPILSPIDLNGNGVRCPATPGIDGSPSDRELLKQTGVFFLESWKVPGTTRHHTLDTITDGMTYTILLTENVRVGFDPLSPLASWANPDPMLVSFYLTSEICRGGSCSAANMSQGAANGVQGINAGLSRAEGEAPWPSSYHYGGVNICLADGSVRFLSENVASTIYYSLVTSQGADFQGPLKDDVAAPSDY